MINSRRLFGTFGIFDILMQSKMKQN